MKQRTRPLARSTKPIARTARLARGSAPKRTRRPRKQRKSSMAKLRRDLWNGVAAYVKATHGDTCFTCGATGLSGKNLQAGHFVNAGKSAAVRYHPDNLRPQCSRCNIWLRGNIASFSLHLLDEIGEAKFRDLMARSRQLKKWTAPEVRELIAALERGGADYELAYQEMTNAAQ